MFTIARSEKFNVEITTRVLLLAGLSEASEPYRGETYLRRQVSNAISNSILRGHEKAVLSAAFSPDGMRVVTASEDGTARVWRADGVGEPVILRGHEDTVRSVAFSPDGTRVVTASFDGTARVWWVDGGSEPVNPWP